MRKKMATRKNSFEYKLKEWLNEKLPTIGCVLFLCYMAFEICRGF